MKIIGVDNHARESVADILIAENIQNEAYAETMLEALREKYGCDGPGTWFIIRPDDYKLWGGMAELV